MAGINVGDGIILDGKFVSRRRVSLAGVFRCGRLQSLTRRRLQDGHLRFKGEVAERKGIWLGLEMEGPCGDCDGSWGGTNPPMPWGWRGGKNNSGVYDNVSTPLFQCVFKESWENCDASRGDYAGNGSCLSRMTRFLIEGVEGRCSMTRSLTCGGRQRLQSTPASTRTRGSET